MIGCDGRVSVQQRTRDGSVRERSREFEEEAGNELTSMVTRHLERRGTEPGGNTRGGRLVLAQSFAALWDRTDRWEYQPATLGEL